jgi:hypothetical protein
MVMASCRDGRTSLTLDGEPVKSDPSRSGPATETSGSPDVTSDGFPEFESGLGLGATGACTLVTG